MIALHQILVLLPAYNEADSIREVIGDLKKENYPNIVVVDDGSHDETRNTCLDSGLKVISHRINRGAGAAIQTGIEYARTTSAEFLVIMDADGQHKAEDISLLLRKISGTEAGMVIGNRFENSTNEIPRIRRFYNWIANVITNLPNRKNYKDTQSGFRVLSRDCFEKINLRIDGFGFCSEMIWQVESMKYEILEVPIKVIYTEHSMKKGQNFAVGVRTALNLLFERIL